MVTVNLFSSINATRIALPTLREQSGEHIVNVSSDARYSANA